MDRENYDGGFAAKAGCALLIGAIQIAIWLKDERVQAGILLALAAIGLGCYSWWTMATGDLTVRGPA